jgi:hypothetical protein
MGSVCREVLVWGEVVGPKVSRAFFECCVRGVVGASGLYSAGSFSGHYLVRWMVFASPSCSMGSLISVLWGWCTRGLFGGV